LVINKEKCVFGIEEVEFLGHNINTEEVSPIASRIAATMEHPQPTTVKELQGFLGVINFYCRFVPAAAYILKPLTDQLKGNPKPTAAVLWTSSMQFAFEKAKTFLEESFRLIHPSPGAEISLVVDASAKHIGPLCSSSHIWWPHGGL
jgi:hypothetical protein